MLILQGVQLFAVIIEIMLLLKAQKKKNGILTHHEVYFPALTRLLLKIFICNVKDFMQLIYCYILFLNVCATKDIRILCFDYVFDYVLIK